MHRERERDGVGGVKVACPKHSGWSIVNDQSMDGLSMFKLSQENDPNHMRKLCLVP